MAPTLTPPPQSSPSLRVQQKELARRLIIEAAARLIVRNGIHQLSMQDVADEAGVALRTVYRYFPGREELVEGVGAEIDRRLADAGMPRDAEAPITPGSVATIVADAYRMTGREGADLARAGVIINMATGARPAFSRRRDRLVHRAIEELGPHLDPVEHDRVFGAIRVLASSTAWKVMTDDLGMENEEVVQAATWAVTTLLENVEAGGRPADGPAGP